MSYHHGPVATSQFTSSAAAEEKDLVYDFPSLSESTSSLSCVSVNEAKFPKRTTAAESNPNPIDSEILRGAEILRLQIQRLEGVQPIEKETRNMGGSSERLLPRVRQYRNSNYFSDTDDEDEPWDVHLQQDKRSIKDERSGPCQFPETGQSMNDWVKFPEDYYYLDRNKIEQFPEVVEKTSKKTPATADLNVERPSKGSFPKTALRSHPAEDMYPDHQQSLGFGTDFQDKPSTLVQPSPQEETRACRKLNPSSLSKTYQMRRVTSQISSAESKALDILASQFPADKEQENSLSSMEEDIVLVAEDKGQKEFHETGVATYSSAANYKSPSSNVVSPFSETYKTMVTDPAFLHAQQAGTLWQSLVSQHVKFPTKWWNGARAPSMGVGERQLWQYVGRHRVGGDESLNKIVYNRGSAGRILLHLIVQDVANLAPALDIVIGCFHPNARGVRSTPNFQPSLEDCRDVWLATRHRIADDLAVEILLRDSHIPGINQGESPLGPKHAVHNGNMRFIFGERPPLYTAFALESTIHNILTNKFANLEMPPSLVLLQRYLKVR
eukprot:scaffold1366_cov91-Cylindrotheca_fusiformis.AAC.7